MTGNVNLTFLPQASNHSLMPNASECSYEKGICITERFYLISVFGSCVASCSAAGNLLLIYVLSRPKLVASQLFFLLMLAFVDSYIAFSYIFLFSVQILYDHLESLLLYEMWNRYVKILYATSHAAITGSTYLIVAASADRCFSAWTKSSFTVGQRFVGLAIIAGVALVTKGIVYWEIDVVHKSECFGFEAYELVLTTLAQDETYRFWVILWFRNVAHVFLPIILLIILNGAIIFKFSQNPNSASRRLTRHSMGSCAEDESLVIRRKNIKAATRMLLVLVATYLLANLLSFVISIWEHVNQSYLFANQVFYTFATDLITLSTVLTGFLRLPIYYSCNNQIKQEIHALFKKFSREKSKNDNGWNNSNKSAIAALESNSGKEMSENDWVLIDCQVHEEDVPWELTKENGK